MRMNITSRIRKGLMTKEQEGISQLRKRLDYTLNKDNVESVAVFPAVNS